MYIKEKKFSANASHFSARCCLFLSDSNVRRGHAGENRPVDAISTLTCIVLLIRPVPRLNAPEI